MGGWISWKIYGFCCSALSLLSAALSTATHSNIFGNSKLEADGERSREDFESDKLSCWGPMGAVEL